MELFGLIDFGGYLNAFADARIKPIAGPTNPELVQAYGAMTLVYIVRNVYEAVTFLCLCVLLPILAAGALGRIIFRSHTYRTPSPVRGIIAWSSPE